MSRGGLLRSTAVFSAMTLLSRVAGLARDLLQAALFGAGPAVSAFVVAYRIPNYLRRVFAEGSFSSAFVPVLSELKQQGDEAALKDFLDHVAGALLAVVLVITALGMLLAPWIARLFLLFADKDSQQVALTADMLRITFPYLAFISMTALSGAVLNCFRQFGLPAFTPVLHNLAVIFAMLVLAPLFRRACLCTGLGRVPGRAGATAAAVAGARPARPAAALPARLPARRRAPGVHADAADDLFLLGVAAQPAGRHHVRLAAGGQRAELAVLHRPPDRIPAGHVRGRDRHRDPAAPVASPCRHRRGRLLARARLGPAPGDAGRRARGAGRGAAGRTAVFDPVLPRRLHRAGHAHGGHQRDRDEPGHRRPS